LLHRRKIKENTFHLCYKDQSRDVGIEVITVQKEHWDWFISELRRVSYANDPCTITSSLSSPNQAAYHLILGLYGVSSLTGTLVAGRGRKLDGPSTYLESEQLRFGASFNIQIRSYISYRSGSSGYLKLGKKRQIVNFPI